ncbi:MAG: Mth938-like domain-containing protein [Hyphomicrobiales bacterium]|nr:Mth938-like domain-containing protein [Hyphomicrobiales bacterium]MCA1999553.1 Mth938-like domain-containing protein [Hyphomicrobiales bacterium]
MAQGFVPGGHMIDSYGNGGFRFAGMSHQGSVIAMPTGIQVWAVRDPARIDVASLTPVIVEMGRIDLLIVGTGDKALPVDAPFARALRELGLQVDVMDTPSAARTYNVLFSEGRRVAAALIAVG